MKVLLFIVGLVFVAAGILIGVVSQTDYGNALIGLTPGLAATLLVGGFIVTGLAGVIGAIDRLGDDLPQSLPSGQTGAMETSVRPEPGRKEPDSKDNMPFPAATAAVGAAAGATGMAIGSALDSAGEGVEKAVDKVAEAAKEAKEKAADVADTVGDMADKAKDTAESAVDKVADLAADAKDAVSDAADEVTETVEDAKEAVDDTDAMAEEVTDEKETESAEEVAKGEDGEQLYIVEEVEIRGKAARVLSDNTVEAETDEGWMRFENIEHLEEYLDAMQA